MLSRTMKEMTKRDSDDDGGNGRPEDLDPLVAVDLGGQVVATAAVAEDEPDDGHFDEEEDGGGDAEDDEVEVADVLALFADGFRGEGLGSGDAGAEQEQAGHEGAHHAEAPGQGRAAPALVVAQGAGGLDGLRHGRGGRRWRSREYLH